MVRKFERLGVNVRGQTFSDPNGCARTRLLLFRRRLGALTNEQELQIENLRISTITKVSLLTARALELLSETSGRKRGSTDCDIKRFDEFEER